MMTSGPSISTRRSNSANVENARLVDRNALLAERVRRHIELDVVRELRVPDGRVERSTSLDHDALYVARMQLAEGCLDAWPARAR